MLEFRDKKFVKIKMEVNFFLKKMAEAGDLGVASKSDGSLVTKVDYFVSELVKRVFHDEISSGVGFLSEEEMVHTIQFPMMVLDPIDGTNGLVQNNGECCISFCYFNSPLIEDPMNFAWIYNPFTGFEVCTNSIITEESLPLSKAHSTCHVFVSRREWESKLYDDLTACAGFSVAPMGSIALKLGLMTAGACNMIVTKRPKKIWDIAAGTVLLANRGIHCYSQGKRIIELSELKYEPDLVWASDERYDYYINSNVKKNP